LGARIKWGSPASLLLGVVCRWFFVTSGIVIGNASFFRNAVFYGIGKRYRLDLMYEAHEMKWGVYHHGEHVDIKLKRSLRILLQPASVFSRKRKNTI
jgi:hypothetical protein